MYVADGIAEVVMPPLAFPGVVDCHRSVVFRSGTPNTVVFHVDVQNLHSIVGDLPLIALDAENELHRSSGRV